MPYGEALFEEHSNTRDMPYLFNSKERDEETGLYYYGARYLDPETAVWYGVDLLAMEHPDYSPYIYCTNNPLKYIDPDGRDPIYAKNFWGKVRMIGDDGQSSTGSYLVRGSVARDVKSATKAGEFYTGSLVESKNIVHVPTGQKLEGVKQSFEDTKLSQRENGGHSNIGDANVTRWDEGPTAVAFTDKDGNRGAEATLQMFVVNGQNTMPADASNVEMWWHTHPNTTVNGVSLGNSNPSDADYSGQKIMTKKGYKGNTFVIGVRSGTVTFFNKDGALQTVKWSDFLRMGGQEK
jgi:RHS repeat-associated protein